MGKRKENVDGRNKQIFREINGKKQNKQLKIRDKMEKN